MTVSYKQHNEFSNFITSKMSVMPERLSVFQTLICSTEYQNQNLFYLSKTFEVFYSLL